MTGTVRCNDPGGEYPVNRFVNQFVLGPAFVDRLQGWRRVSVSDTLRLTAHPGLAVTQVRDGGNALTVIGYMLDPADPAAGNADIANTLMAVYRSRDQLIRATTTLGGRWVLIAREREQTLLFSDTLGLRQVFYTTAGFAHGFWAVSQPGLLVWLFRLAVDRDAAAYLDDYEIRKHPEYRWPVSASPLAHTRRLLPNRWLAIDAVREHRFWPSCALGPVDYEEGLERAAGLLEGLMDAAYQRFELVHGITAGYDSRTVLAAARKHRDRIRTVTVRQGRMPDDHRDIAVPARLLGKLAIPHTVIRARPAMSAEFSKAFKENVLFAHDHYGPDAEAIAARFARQKVVVTGSGAEVVKTCFRERIDAGRGHYTGADLARVQWMGDNAFAVNHFSAWLRETGDLYDVHLLDLLAWEQLDGGWLAATQLEFDIAWREIFTPFNCRALLECLLSVEERYRRGPDYPAFSALVEMMWPELLAEPLNPEGRARNFRVARSWWRTTKRIMQRRPGG